MKRLLLLLALCLPAVAQEIVPLEWDFAWDKAATSFVLHWWNDLGSEEVTVPGSQLYADLVLPRGITNYVECVAIYKGVRSRPSNIVALFYPVPLEVPAPVLRVRVPLSFSVAEKVRKPRTLRAPKWKN